MTFLAASNLLRFPRPLATTLRFPVVIGSDLIYDVATVEALYAAVIAHVADGGVLYLMSQRDRSGLPELQTKLAAAGEVELEEFTLVNDYGVSPVVLTTFRPTARATPEE